MLLLFFLDYTFPFYSSNSPKNGNVNAMTKKPGDIIILHEGTKNHDQKLCCSWNITRVRCNCYCSFWAIFNPFTTLTVPKHENLKKKKKKKTPWNIIILHKCTKNHDHMLYCSWDIWCVMDLIVIFHFGQFFALSLPNSPKNKSLNKKKKRPGGITNSHKCTKNHDHMLYCSRDLWCMMDGIVIFDFWLSFAHLTP